MFMRAREMMEIYGISRNTLCAWTKSGQVKVNVLPSGRYDYRTLEEVYVEKEETRKSVIYARVSSSTQKADLPRQIERLKDFSMRQGIIIHDSYSEVASALNYNRKQYRRLYREIHDNKINTVVIEHKDRLLRIGFDDFLELCALHKTKVVVANEDVNISKTKEIVDDMISIIHHFSAKVYSNRRTKKIVDLIKQDDDKEDSVE